IERMIEAPGSLRSAIHLAETASRAFKEPRTAHRHVAELVRFGDLVEADLASVLNEAGDAATSSDVKEACAILADALPDAHLRVHEVLARHDVPRPRVTWRSADLAHEIDSLGAAITVLTDNDSVEAPAGLGRAIRSIARTRESTTRVQEIVIHETDALELAIRGTTAPGYFAPLGRGLRPSELREVLEERGEPLRGTLLLAYYTLPDGRAEIVTDDREQASASPFTLNARLSRTVPVPESD
ncbi:MAG: hypothetical protein ACOC0O_00660, partial [Spirochaetota bacterium]